VTPSRRLGAGLRALVASLALALSAGGPAMAETLVAALSTPMVSINSNFAGTDVTVFGTIAPDKGKAAPAHGYDVVVVLEGPKRPLLVRHKERTLGVWVNRQGRFYPDVPVFHAMAATLPIAMLADPADAARLGLGLDDIHFGGKIAGDGSTDFRDAVLRQQKQRGLFTEYPTSVAFLGDQLFSTTIPIPAEVPIGQYGVRVAVFADKALVATSVVDLLVVKSGFEQQVADLAGHWPVLYGLLSVVIALLTGWIGGVLFRRD
jgi:uncharacterized protein (TIGR02186 family)